MPRGFSRSRALWDEARRPNAPRLAIVRAILYELQPVRFSAIDVSAITASLRSIWSGSVSFTVETVPFLTRETYLILTGMTRRHWMIVAGVIVYYYVVRMVHNLLDAGPLMVIVTALVIIFTIGLGDTATRDGVSAYSVFNRGFERILGTVDAEALVQQHVGGAMGFAAAGVAAPPQPVVEPMHQQEPVARARRRHDNNDNQDENVARAANDGDDDDDNVPERGTSRKSGKKARRRNLEQRREQQRQLQAQRDAAIAMGFTENEGEEEAMAMQRLLEEQIAAANNEQ